MTKKSSDYIKLDETYGAHNYHPLPVVISRAKGIKVYDPEGKEYAFELVEGVLAESTALDSQIEKAATHWRVSRMSRVDRNLLRIGTFEMQSKPDVPTAVLIDEAVELAKRYGSSDSSSFVNGILNRLAELIRSNE